MLKLQARITIDEEVLREEGQKPAGKTYVNCNLQEIFMFFSQILKVKFYWQLSHSLSSSSADCRAL